MERVAGHRGTTPWSSHWNPVQETGPEEQEAEFGMLGGLQVHLLNNSWRLLISFKICTRDLKSEELCT